MHDAPPPPLDRQGIGRLLLCRAVHGADITLNDGTTGRLRRTSGNLGRVPERVLRVDLRTGRARPHTPEVWVVRLRESPGTTARELVRAPHVEARELVRAPMSKTKR